jgi:hypothetical protein
MNSTACVYYETGAEEDDMEEEMANFADIRSFFMLRDDVDPQRLVGNEPISALRVKVERAKKSTHKQGKSGTGTEDTSQNPDQKS